MNTQLKKHIVRRWRIIITLQSDKITRQQRAELKRRMDFVSNQIRIIQAIEAFKSETYAKETV